MSAAIEPAFGQADLTNCERELIQFAGSIQPHGCLLVLDASATRILQVSENVLAMLGIATQRLLDAPLEMLGDELPRQLRLPAFDGPLAEPRPLRCSLAVGGAMRPFEGFVHRLATRELVVELEPLCDVPGATPVAGCEPDFLVGYLPEAVRRFCASAQVGVLADAVARSVRDITGYDRVMVYRFDPDGHGQIIAEARDPRLESLLGHRYPATDIPQRARELYLRNRVRVLVDVGYEPVPLVPSQLPGADGPLDMSMCSLRSMSPLHLQYLKNMGVTATLVVSLVRDGALWGLVAAHHYQPRSLRLATRLAMAMLAEVVSTRLAAIENYAHAQVAIQVGRLEQRLIEATSNEGDWRLALFRNPRTLLQPLEASGAALFYDGEILTAGEVPSTPEMRELIRWIDGMSREQLFACASVSKANPALASIGPIASGVLALRLSTERPDFLVWFRKEQLHAVTWAGDPAKPVVRDNPLELSPRRSFAAWSEIVQGTALPWSAAEIALARAIGTSLIDIIVQVHGVRLLIAEHQLAQTQVTVENANEPVLIASAAGRVLFVNRAFRDVTGCAGDAPSDLDALAARLAPAAKAQDMLAAVRQFRQAWRGELAFERADGGPLPIGLRADVVPGQDGSVLGYMLILRDLSDVRRVAAARRQLEDSLSRAASGASLSAVPEYGDLQVDDVIRTILTNASIAAMDIGDGPGAQVVAPMLAELEASTRRATEFYGQVQQLTRGAPATDDRPPPPADGG